MNKKISLIILSIVLILSIISIVLVVHFRDNNLKSESAVEAEIETGIEKLSDKAKAALNKEELVQDIKSKKEGKELIHAKKEQNSTEDQYLNRYNGNGYYYKEFDGGECISYRFYSSIDDTLIYGYDKIYPMTMKN